MPMSANLTQTREICHPMTLEEQKILIQNYIAAYNSFDIDGMLALVHPEVLFKNIADGQINAEAKGTNSVITDSMRASLTRWRP